MGSDSRFSVTREFGGRLGLHIGLKSHRQSHATCSKGQSGLCIVSNDYVHISTNSMPAAHMNTVCRSTLFVFAISLAAITLKAQNPAPTPLYSDQAELSKVEEWVLSQGTAASIAPELAAILGLGSDRLPVKLKSFRASNDGVSQACAVSTNPIQKGIVLSALKAIQDNKMEIYSLGTAWLTDRSGTLHRTIEVNASGVRVVSNTSHAAEFKDIKAFFLKKLKATTPTTTSSPSP